SRRLITVDRKVPRRVQPMAVGQLARECPHEITYTITVAGIAQLDSGRKQLPKVRRRPQRRTGTFRADVWRALRIKRRSSLPDLVAAIGTEPADANRAMA